MHDPIFAPLDVSDSVNNAIENLTDKPTTEMGNTIGDIWYLIFGGISYHAEKRKIKYAHALEEYRQSLENKVLSIPDYRLKEPDLQVIGQALDDSKYCAENENVRSLFENLIASSIDKGKEAFVHPSFSGMIKQMNALDAKNMALYKDVRQIPIVEYRLVRVNGTFTTIERNYTLVNLDIATVHQQQASFSSLERFGLIDIDYTIFIPGESVYSDFENTSIMQQMRSFVVPAPDGGFSRPKDDEVYKEATFIKGRALITPLGDNFIKACFE